jgi:hypothetical protein
MLKKFLLGFLCCFLATTAFAVEVRVDKANLAADEILTLVISSKDHINIAPDLSPLRRDFDVVGTSQSSQFNIINGTTQMETEWQITLLPKHPGEIVLPSIQVGSERTAPRLIHVTAARGGASNLINTQKNDLFMEVSVVPKEAYIQEQFVYTLKLFYNRTIENPYLIGPDLTDAKISQTGQDILYTTSKNGRYYRVLERTYLITPKNVGNFKIGSPILKGYVDQSGNSFSAYGLASNTLQPIKIIGPAIEIKIKPKPLGFKGQWLPAKKLTLSDSWKTNTPVREGEPTTRIIEIQVEGATGEQIPALAVHSGPNLHIYPQQPKRETKTNGNIQFGKMIQKLVYIPTASGQVEIPTIKMHWWNSETKKEQVAIIPHKIIKVLPAIIKNNDNGQVAPLSKYLTVTPDIKMAKVQSSVILTQIRNQFWPLIALFFIAAWLMTLLLWRQQTSSGSKVRAMKSRKKMTLAESQKFLREACMVDHAKQARKAFLAWAISYWKDPSLHALSDIVFLLKGEEANALKAQIMQLEAIFYSKNKRDWNGADFWVALQDYLKVSQQKMRFKEDPLPPLYPSEQ